MENKCPQCGAPIDPGAVECRFCGERFATQQAAQQFRQPQPQPQVVYAQPQVIVQQAPPMPNMYNTTAINPAWPIKNKTVAGLLAIFFGGLGIHKFYMGKIGMGILYLCFCWTYIPALVAFIEGIMYLCSNDENFMLKNHVRIG